MFNKKLLVLLVFLVSLVFIFAGCSDNSSDIIHDMVSGDLAIVFNNNQNEGISPLSISDDISINSYEITITNNSKQYSKELEATHSSVVFENISIGVWDIEVLAKDNDGVTIYKGNGQANIETNTTTEVTIDLYLEPGDLSITIPDINNVDHGTITLINNLSEGSDITENLTITDTEATVSLSDIQAGTWDIEIKLYDASDSLLDEGSDLINVYPGQNNEYTIELSPDGDLNITLNIHKSPSDPTGLSASVESGQVVLNWTANPESNIAGYVVYKSQEESGMKTKLTDNVINQNSYTDTDVVEGSTYYYWVRAYDTDGYSSDLSDSCSTLNKNELLFLEDWENGLIDGEIWKKFGSPQSQVFSSKFNRNGVFDNNGDGNDSSGVIKKNPLTLQPPFTIESSIYLDFQDETGCWLGANFALYTDYENIDGRFLNINIGYSGDACWATPEEYRRHAYLNFGFEDSNGDWIAGPSEGDGNLQRDDLLNDWHIYKIIVDEEYKVSFYVDDELIFKSNLEIEKNKLDNCYLYLGNRSSGSAGKAYHDYIKVTNN